jgi:hypothetical protein
LADGTFSNQKSRFGKILEFFAMKDVGISNAHLVYFWLFGIFCGHFVHFMVIWYIFFRFGMLQKEKSGNSVSDAAKKTIT